VTFGSESLLYSFPNGHPLNSGRVEQFGSWIRSQDFAKVLKPLAASEDQVMLFHTKEYLDRVRESSQSGEGYLDYGDTPSYKGVYEASLFTVGGSLFGYNQIVNEIEDHFFNPVGGLHHARRNRAGGFCVFNDCAVAITKALETFDQVAYVDIDAHHGDGVFYGFENDPRVIIGDIHEDGKYLYPGTGFASETGKGKAEGTKLNISLDPGSGDEEFKSI
jgi:acetoin utilization protein AcuC